MLNAAGRLLLEAFERWRQGAVDDLAAALAYYSLFSLTPLLMLGVAVSGALTGRGRATEFVSELARLTVGAQGLQLIRPMLDAAPLPHAITLATVVGLGALVYGASTLFLHLHGAFNSIWKAPERTTHWLRSYLERRLLSIAVVLCMAVLLIVGPVLDLGLARLGRSQWLGVPVSVALETGIFGALFRFLPDVVLPWRALSQGALLTAVLFAAAQSILGLYLDHVASRSIYGAAGSLIALLVWVYVSAHILLFGAEFTQVLREREGGGS